MKTFLLALVVPSLLIAAESDYKDREKFEAILEKLAKVESLSERVEKASEAFLDVPFADGPLGEGKDGKYDNDPLCRADKFDCTTYVETVAALALTADWRAFTKQLDRIRYFRGDVSFTARNHFPELDWIPNNIEEKIFKDVTAEIGGKEVKVASTTIKKRAWYLKFDAKRLTRPDLKMEDLVKLVADLHDETKTAPEKKVELNYIPFRSLLTFSDKELKARAEEEQKIKDAYKEAKDKAPMRAELAAYRKKFLADRPEAVFKGLLDKFPSGAVLNYVHPDRPLEKFIGTNMLVTHQGFLIRKRGEVYIRHAALNDKVLDVKLVDYINVFMVPGALDPQGFNVLELRRP